MAEPNLTDLARRLRPLLMPTMDKISSTVVESATVQILAGTGLTGGGLLDQDRTLSINLAANLTWTGTHGFQGTVTTRHLTPEATDQYDLGSSLKLWRKGWLSELDAVVFAQNTVTLIGGWLIIGKGEGTLPADVASGATSIDFGQAMTSGDFVLMRAAGKVEYLSVGSLVSGTTYNVTRNLDGSGANDWPAGTPYAVLGQSGAGRIELNAYDTPRISILRQGATYNAATEPVRIGDLNGWDDVGTERYGIGMGDYAGGNYLRYEPGAGFIFRSSSGKMQIDANGPTFLIQSALDGATAIDWRSAYGGGTQYAYLEAHTSTGGSHQINLVAPGAEEAAIQLENAHNFGTNPQSKIILNAGAGLSVPASIDIIGEATAGRTSEIILDAVAIEIAGHFAGHDGWLLDLDGWTYQTASTFTLFGSDLTARFPLGTKIKLTQPTLGVKYFYVIGCSFSTPTTTVTITGGSDYTLANEAITSPLYSYEASPQGFPGRFNYTPTWTGSGSNPSIGDGTLEGKFAIQGKLCHYTINITAGSTTTYGSGNYSFALPVAVANYQFPALGLVSIYDANTGGRYTRLAQLTSLATTLTNIIALADGTTSVNITPTAPITFATGDIIRAYGSYQI